MNATDSTQRPVLWGLQGWLGLLLLAVCWPLNWTLAGSRTAYLFFPLWLGYILVVDALVLSRTGTSIWTRSRGEFRLLFVTAVPAWWLLSVRLDVAGVPAGAAELLAGPPALLTGFGAGGLAAGGFPGRRGSHLRVLL